MLSDQATELLAALRRTLRTWHCAIDGTHVEFGRDGGTRYRPARRAPSWEELLGGLETAFAEHGIARGRLLPLRGSAETDFTISAVQALDPYLKRREPVAYGSGFLPQPVVRFTGDRDEHGTLKPGFLTAFVNVSCVRPIAGVADHAALIDAWLSVLSRLGVHARRIRIAGTFAPWTRREVCGITLRFRHDGLTLGDAVLLWNAEQPGIMATDIGSGLERLRWALTRRPWPETVFDALAGAADVGTLDAIRTAVLITGAGIAPASRGPGSAVRRLLRGERERAGTLGVSRAVRWAHRFWTLTHPLPVPWPEVCRIVESELFDGR